LEFIYGDTVATSQHQWTPALGVPFESSGKNTATRVPQEIIESDDSEFEIGDHFIPVENTQPKKKRNVSPDIEEKVTKGKAKVGTTTTMRITFERLVDATEGHNEVEKAKIVATSHVHGQYSIPDCVKLLKSAKEDGFLNGQQFSYALEMLKDEQNQVLLVTLKDSKVDWVE